MPKEHIEEYLEAIYDIAGREGTAKTKEIAERLQNAPASVTEVFQRMKQKGLVRYESHKGVTLTAKGYKAATKMKRKHQLLEVFLDKMLLIIIDNYIYFIRLYNIKTERYKYTKRAIYETTKP